VSIFIFSSVLVLEILHTNSLKEDIQSSKEITTLIIGASLLLILMVILGSLVIVNLCC
jgi:hypothetical protein